jgi:hypothetical protein
MSFGQRDSMHWTGKGLNWKCTPVQLTETRLDSSLSKMITLETDSIFPSWKSVWFCEKLPVIENSLIHNFTLPFLHGKKKKKNKLFPVRNFYNLDITSKYRRKFKHTQHRDIHFLLKELSWIPISHSLLTSSHTAQTHFYSLGTLFSSHLYISGLDLKFWYSLKYL